MQLMAQYHSARSGDQGLIWLLDRLRLLASTIADAAVPIPEGGQNPKYQ